MGFKIAGYSFAEGHPIDQYDEIKSWPGLYAILCKRGRGHYLIDIGESDDLKTELRSKGKRKLWKQKSSGDLLVSIYYTLDMEQSERKRIERKIRKRHNPPCGRGW